MLPLLASAASSQGDCRSSDAAQGEAEHAIAMLVGQTIDAMLITLKVGKPGVVSTFPSVCIAACQCRLGATIGAGF